MQKKTRCCLFTEHRCTILLHYVHAVRHVITIPFGGALCYNVDEVSSVQIVANAGSLDNPYI